MKIRMKVWAESGEREKEFRSVELDVFDWLNEAVVEKESARG